MRYKLLGRSGLRVSELCMGTMTFGEDWGWGASKEVSRKIFDRFADAGGNFIDTSYNYTNGTSERFVGEFTAADRDHFVIATKYTLTLRRADPNAGGNHRKNLFRSLDESLKRLQTDHLDLLWLHMWDGVTPVEEVMRALDDVIRAGKVLYAGISDTPAWVVAQANTLADLRGWSRFVAVQAPYSLADRSVEREIIPMARAFDMAFTPWGLLEGGELTGKYSAGADATGPRRYEGADERNIKLAEGIQAIAGEIGRTASQVAINWVRAQTQPHAAPIIPILGARTEQQIEANLACLDFELSEEQLARLTALSPLSLGFPRSFLESSHVRGLIFGDTFSQLDSHRA